MLAGCSGPLCVIADYFTRPIILFFAAGILLALARRWLEARQKVPEISTRTAIATSLVVAFLYGAAVISGLVQENTASSALVQALACGIATTVCGLEVYSGGPNGFYRSLLLALGNASYSIYLTHSFIMGSAGRIWALISNGYVSTMSAVIFVMLMILGASILGILSYRYVERPLLDLLRSRVTGDRQAVA